MAISYRTAIIREVTNALKETFNNHLDPAFNGIYVGPDYPNERQEYPCIVVRYSQSMMQNLGMGHYWMGDGVTDTLKYANHWLFQGTLGFTAMAMTSQDRDLLADAVLEIVSWGANTSQYRRFHIEVEDNDFVPMTIMKDSVSSDPGQTFPTPWATENEQLYISTHAYPITGECYSATDGILELVRISKIVMYPYRRGQPEPTGANDPGIWYGG